MESITDLASALRNSRRRRRVFPEPANVIGLTYCFYRTSRANVWAQRAARGPGRQAATPARRWSELSVSHRLVCVSGCRLRGRVAKRAGRASRVKVFEALKLPGHWPDRLVTRDAAKPQLYPRLKDLGDSLQRAREFGVNLDDACLVCRHLFVLSFSIVQSDPAGPYSMQCAPAALQQVRRIAYTQGAALRAVFPGSPGGGLLWRGSRSPAPPARARFLNRFEVGVSDAADTWIERRRAAPALSSAVEVGLCGSTSASYADSAGPV